MPISPPEDELKRAIIDLKSQNPSLGISKVHAYLLAMYPHWTVSEKRTRKILQAEGLTLITKGKGLVATEDIAQGETLWREDPFVIAPEW